MRGDNKKNVSEMQYHDLRYLENQFHTHEEPTVLVRKHTVLISLNPLRAIVTADRMILIVPDGADSLLYMLHDYMHGKIMIYCVLRDDNMMCIVRIEEINLQE